MLGWRVVDGPGSLVWDAPSVRADRVLLIDFFCDVLHPRLYPANTITL